jgi:hypothetical protein
MSANKSKPRNHHRQPELYLRGFCNEPSFLWVYERGKPWIPGKQKRHKFNPCKLGVTELSEKDAYTVVKPDGARDFASIESEHQKIETKTDNVLLKIRSQSSILPNEKDVFAKYMQNMHWRTRKHEEEILPKLDGIQKDMPWNDIALQYAQMGEFKLAREHYDAQKYLRSNNGKKFLVSKSMVTLHPTIHQILKSMSWKFYVASSESYFLTSSTPVIFDPVGLLKSSLLFPISKNIALIATHDGKRDLEYINASSDETLAINYYTITQSSSIYSPKDDYWIWDFLENGTRVNWLENLLKLMPFQTIN